LSKLNLHVDSSSDDILADLKLIIRQPSVSAVKQGLVECANVVASIMDKAGIATEIMHLYNKREGIDSDSDVPLLSYGMQIRLVEGSKTITSMDVGQLMIKVN
jgi:acetylornithine deacetylase/succinyl-diaminopimelate desuccinylase-like protein